MDAVGLFLGIVSVLLGVVGLKASTSEKARRQVAGTLEAFEPGTNWFSQLPVRLSISLAVVIIAYYAGLAVDLYDEHRLSTERDLAGRIVYCSKSGSGAQKALSAFNLWSIDPDRRNKTQITFSRDDHSPSISRSGDIVLQSTGADGARRLCFLEDDASLTPLELFGDPEEAYAPVWSPDGAKIAYAAALDSDSFDEARLASLDSAAPATGNLNGGYCIGIYDVKTGESYPVWTHEAVLGSPTWSPDGKSLAFESKNAKNLPYKVIVLDIASGDVLATYGDWDEHSSARYPEFTSDGKSLAVTYVDESSRYTTYVGPVEEKTGRPFSAGRYIFAHEDGVAAARFAPDGKSIAYLAIRDGEWSLFVQDTRDKTVKRLTSSPTGRPAWSNDSQSLVYPVLKNQNWELERYELANQSRATLTNDGVAYYRPDVARNGDIICQRSYYAVQRDDWNEGLALVNQEGVQPVELPKGGPTEAHCPSWNLAGSLVAFNAAADGASDDIWTFDPRSPISCERTTDGRGDYLLPEWISDTDQALAVDASSGNRLVIIDTKNPTKRPRTLFARNSRVSDPAPSPDGRHVAFVSTKNGLKDGRNHELEQLYVSAVGMQPGEPLLESESVSYSEPCWAPDGSAIAVVATTWDADDTRHDEIQVLILDETTFFSRFRIVDSYVLCDGSSPAWTEAPVAGRTATEAAKLVF